MRDVEIKLVAEVIEVSGLLKDISECVFTWRECCEERDNDITSDTSLLVIHGYYGGTFTGNHAHKCLKVSLVLRLSSTRVKF